ncbi:AAA family ATPase [Candidatus Cetobacterium colombiensis]|uniref:AAA family ATPase n=1 Tax=Candidatus Cetobacterium colombiensis TaxID=3073100 RepID=A0ABU4WAM8_9FUSO|nr:AAA family ATPase [Candidatus Cetobacterium colombiensis]MDX8336598.1 AAA family ATPase [Candidatus Cetobacterium colombiensis]
MNIKQIRLINFKNIDDSTIIFKNNMSGIYGPNGVGKTSIIEAISLFKDYFSKPVKTDENRNNLFNKKLEKYIKIGEAILGIEAILYNEDNNIDYTLALEFERRDKENFICSREELSYKKSNSKALEKNLIKVIYDTEDVYPKVMITDFDYKSFISPYLNDSTLSVRDLLMNYNNFYSYAFQAKKLKEALVGDLQRIAVEIGKEKSDLLENTTDENNNFKNLKLIEKKYMLQKEKAELKINNDSQLVLDNINIVKEILENILTIELKDQLLCKDTISIPIKCFENNKMKTIVYNENQNIYDEDEADLLEKTINEINSIISIIIPNSKLLPIPEDEGINTQRNIRRKSVKLYMKKEGDEIPLVNESTGTIKLISLISILIFCLKNKKATVFIDEFDVHIFEYLLATLLLVIGKHLKGQLIFTAHNLLPMEKLNKESIIISTKNEGEIKYTFIKTSSRTNNVRLKYLKSQAMWSEENIDPLSLNIPKLELFIQRLVLE